MLAQITEDHAIGFGGSFQGLGRGWRSKVRKGCCGRCYGSGGGPGEELQCGFCCGKGEVWQVEIPDRFCANRIMKHFQLLPTDLNYGTVNDVVEWIIDPVVMDFFHADEYTSEHSLDLAELFLDLADVFAATTTGAPRAIDVGS